MTETRPESVPEQVTPRDQPKIVTCESPVKSSPTPLSTDIIARINSLNEKELRTWLDTLQVQQMQKEKNYADLLQRYKALQDCFQYNLALISQRDKDLDHLEDEVSVLSDSLKTREEKLADLEKKCTDQEAHIVKLQRLVQENELEYQDTIKSLHRQRQSLLDEKDMQMKQLKDDLEQEKTKVFLELKDASLQLESQRKIWEEEMASIKNLHEQDVDSIRKHHQLEIQSFERQLSSLKEERVASQGIHEQLQKKLEFELSARVDLQDQIKELESTLSDSKRLSASRILSLEGELNQLQQLKEHEAANHEIQIKHLKQQLESIERIHLTEREGLQSQIATLREKLHETDKLTEDVQKSNSEQQLKNRELLSEYEVTLKMKEREIASLSSQIATLQSDVMIKSKEFESIQIQVTEFSNENGRLKDTLKRSEEQLIELKRFQDETARDSQLWQETAATLEHDYSQVQAFHAETQNENERLQREVENLRHVMEDLKAKERERLSILREYTNNNVDSRTEQLLIENNQLKGVIQQMRRDMEELNASVPRPVSTLPTHQYSQQPVAPLHLYQPRPNSNMDMYQEDATQMHQHVSHLQQLLQQKQALVDRLMKVQASLHKKLDLANLQGLKQMNVGGIETEMSEEKAEGQVRMKQYKQLIQTLKAENSRLKQELEQLQEEWKCAVRERDGVIELSNQMKAELDYRQEEKENRKDMSTQTLPTPSASSSTSHMPVGQKPKPKLSSAKQNSPEKSKSSLQSKDPTNEAKTAQASLRSKQMDALDAIKMLRAKGIRNWNDKSDVS